jgi:hypothetical protein
MITGDSWPPTAWMEKRLQQLGEKWPYHPYKNPQAPPTYPPSIESMIAVGNDNAKQVHYSVKETDLWIDQERHCSIPLRCIPERDIKSAEPIELNVGEKGWARIFLVLYDVGGSDVPHPSVSIAIASLGTTNVSLDRIDQRSNYNSGNAKVSFTPNETLDLIRWSKSRSGYEYAIDATVGPTVETFMLRFNIFSTNLEAHTVLAMFRVERKP